MTPWWLIMMGGLLGSSHCLGMCGGFAAIIGMRTKSLATNLREQLIYSGGRLTSYAALGGVAGFVGKRFTDSIPTFINVPAILCLLAGAFLIREGALASGLIRRKISGVSSAGCLMRPIFSSMLRQPGIWNTYSAGMLTGLLPCGLVYAFVSLAASSADLLQGIGTMLAFGCGTLPLMVATGCGVGLLSWPARQRLWKVAGWSVLLTGILTLSRGVAFLQFEEQTGPVQCPFCKQKSSQSPLNTVSPSTTPMDSKAHSTSPTNDETL